MKYKNLKKITIAAVTAITTLTACNSYLDVVPDDGNATIETAFNLRSTAIRFLGTLYSSMPGTGHPAYDPALLGSDELCDLWGRTITSGSGRVSNTMTYIIRGYMSASSVYGNNWSNMYIGIRNCDIMLENVKNVPDMEESERNRWRAEAKFLKALFHFELIRKWGPIPIVKESLPMDASVDDVRVYRDPIDSCFNYVLQLLDEAEPDLPLTVDITDYGRITQPICAAFKARVATFAASPLFNGNEDESSLVDKRGVRLFPSKTEEEKLARWQQAMEACKHALEVCDQANITLYKGDDISYRMNDTLKTDLALRGVMCTRWNSEIIWGNTQNRAGNLNWQQISPPNIQFSNTDSERQSYVASLSCYNLVGVPLKVAEEFYTENGIPIQYDASRVGQNELSVFRTDSSDKFRLQPNYQTVKLNTNREPRYYAFIGFDGGKWLGGLQNYNDLESDDVYDIECKLGQSQGRTGTSKETGPVTGFMPKKMYPYQNRLAGNNSQMSTYYYPWPEMRLADLYLLYSECINEAEGPNGAHSNEMFAYIDSVRSRAKIPSVKEAWDKYSTNPGFYNTQAGMRQIIHRERLIELCFESKRFWDLRRWKEAPEEYSKNAYGFNVNVSSVNDYYARTLIYETHFTQKDYFWPISQYNLEHNPNLIQNIGW